MASTCGDKARTTLGLLAHADRRPLGSLTSRGALPTEEGRLVQLRASQLEELLFSVGQLESTSYASPF